MKSKLREDTLSVTSGIWDEKPRVQCKLVNNIKTGVARIVADHIHMHNCYEPVWIMCPPPPSLHSPNPH